VSNKRLVAENGKLQCWWLPHALPCCFVKHAFWCNALTHYIVKRTDTDFVVALCYKHLPQWAKEGLKHVKATSNNRATTS
jgi:hypothetical protein